MCTYYLCKRLLKVCSKLTSIAADMLDTASGAMDCLIASSDAPPNRERRMSFPPVWMMYSPSSQKAVASGTEGR